MLRVTEQYSATDTGRQRRANEDALLARIPLFVVADGMGGAQAGEVASRMAVEAFRRGLDDNASSDPEGSLTARVKEANARIHELSQNNADQAGMGTTLTAAYVGEEEISVAHVGDSRAYCLRDDELVRLTDDHSLVDELMRQGKLTPEEAEDHPQRSIITRALGPEPAVEVDTSTHRARPGDLYLLCSDGLTSMIPETRVGEILRGGQSLREIGEGLLAAANEAGGRDNITVVLFRLGDAHVDSPDEREQTMLSEPPVVPVSTETEDQPIIPSVVAARQPRRAPRVPSAPKRRRLRWLGPAIAVLAVVGALGAGAYLATQSVYFLSTNGQGLVTIYSGLPFSLPGNLRLYRQYYVSGVPASSIPPPRRHELLDHSLRSERNASQLVRSLELGQVMTR